MGKAGRWLRHFLPGGGRRDRGSKDAKPSGPLAPLPDPDRAAFSVATTTPASTPGAKEKRRWSFRRPAAASPKEKDGRAAYAGFLEPRVDPDQHAVAVAIATAAAAEAAMVAKQAAAAAFRLSASAPGSKRTVVGIEDAAAIKIQSVFRSYLARKALCALRGLVKLQALVRGHLVRRQASHTLRCMQALVAAQHRARVARLRLLEDDETKPQSQPVVPLRTPRSTTPTRRSSPHHPRSSRRQQHPQQEAEENVKIVEVDTGVGYDHHHAHATPRTSSRRSSCYATPLCRTPSKGDVYQKVSPTPSALTDASARSLSGRYDDFSFFATARNSPYHHQHHYYAAAADSRQQVQHHRQQNHSHAAADHPLLVPSYMANTESSRAKARSQSAPRQRHSVSSASAEVPWERQGSARRRASLEGGQQASAAATARGLAVPWCGGARVQRCPSQASEPCPAPWGARLDRWGASAQDSECGSTSTVMTAATTTYCWSMATDYAGVA